MIFSMNDMRKDGVILSNARSENEILQEADHLYSKKNGLTFEEVAPKGPPENMVSIDEYFSHPQTYDFLLDVRSSAEFAESHIPNAINFEILDNYQRREVGILYKNRGKQIATQKALDFANPKLKELKKITQSKKSILIYCWRGGGRSAFVFEALRKIGLNNISRLKGGYKAYRKWVHNKLYQTTYPKLIIVKGMTGVGKTELLHKISSNFRVLDLEYNARHCASSFGSIPYELRNQYEIPSQKLFEDRIFGQLYLSQTPISAVGVLVESESRKIGHRKIPPALFEAMLASNTIEVTANLDSRVNRIYNEYVGSNQAGVELLKRDLKKIQRYLSSQKFQSMQDSLNKLNLKEFISDCLVNYYDQRYAGNYNQKTVAKIDNSDSEEGYQQLMHFLSRDSC